MALKASDRVEGAGGIVTSTVARALDPGEVAWMALLPCVAAAAILVMALGPPLGHALLDPAELDFLPQYRTGVGIQPEPTEHARYLLALLGPLLLAAATFALVRRGPVRRGRAATLLTVGGRVALVLFVVAAVVYQRSFTYGRAYQAPAPFRTAYFTLPTLAAALVVAGGLAWALRSHELTQRAWRLVRESRAKRWAAFGGGVLAIAVWMLTAFNDNTSIFSVNTNVWITVSFWLDEAFAILNGQAPLVDFHAQYGQLWSYLAAGALATFGPSFGVYALTMIAGTALSMLAVLDVFRRLVRSSLVALLLFLPFVATSFFMEEGPLVNRYGPANLFSLFPMRYAGPYLLLWMVVRRVESRPRSPPVLLFVFAWLVTINNVEFGLPALGATLIALIAVEPSRDRAALGRLLASVAGGLAGAVVAVAALTLAVAGSLPHFEFLATFPRIYADGFGLLPMPPFGLHLVLYATFAAALVTAAVRLIEAADDVRLTAALAWVGVFGLGAGGYFVGRSHPQVLVDLFSVWALALVLLSIVSVRRIVRRPTRRITVADAVVFVGIGIAVCSLAQTPAPWSQIRRIADGSSPRNPAAEIAAVERQYVAATSHHGEPIALLMWEGHRIAHDVGVVDVVPYANIDSMPTKAQWVEMVHALRRAGGTRIVAPWERLSDEQAKWIVRAGFPVRHFYKQIGLVEYAVRVRPRS